MEKEIELIYFMYQPKYYHDSIFGYEALLRIDIDGEKKFPKKLHEKYRENIDFDYFIIKAVIIDYIELKKNLINKSISINVSSKFMSTPIDFNKIDIISIKENNLKIEFEILEDDKITNIDVCNRNIILLSEIGIDVSIDDFGRAYSTVRRVINIQNVTFVKLDQSFISDIEKNPKITLSVGKLLKFIHSLGFKVIVEGIESKNVFDILKSIGVEYFQGFYLSKPLIMDTSYHKLPFNFVGT